MIEHLISYCNLGLSGKVRLKSSSELEAYEKGYFSATALYNLNVREDQKEYLILRKTILSKLGLNEHQSWMAKLKCDTMSQREFLHKVLENLRTIENERLDLPSTIYIDAAIQSYIPSALIARRGSSLNEEYRLTIFKQLITNQTILLRHYGIKSFYDLEFFIRGFRESLEYKNMHEVTGLHDPYLRLFTDLKLQSRLEYFIAKKLNISPVSTFGQMLEYFTDYDTGYNLFLNCIDGYIGEPRN